MSDFKLYGRCESCSKSRFFVRKRVVPLPVGKTARSQKKLCGKCYQTVLNMLASNKFKHERENGPQS